MASTLSLRFSCLLTALIALPSFQARADTAAEDAQLEAAVAVQYESNKFEPLEQAVLKAAHGRAAREGDRLTLFLANGRQMTLEDVSQCPAGNITNDNCIGYSLLADLPSRHAFVVSVGHYEGGDVWLIDDRWGQKTALPAIPQFGPANSEFITLDNGVAYGEPGISIWRWRGGNAELVWRHGNELDSIDHGATLIRWSEPDVIVLDLWIGYDFFRAQTHWPAMLKLGPDGWRLESTWPKWK